MCVNERESVCVSERTQVYRKLEICINKNEQQQLQRRGECAYVVMFSLYFLTTTTSSERYGDLIADKLCFIGVKFYDTLVMIQSIGFGEVIDEHDIVSASTEGCHLGWSPHI